MKNKTSNIYYVIHNIMYAFTAQVKGRKCSVLHCKFLKSPVRYENIIYSSNNYILKFVVDLIINLYLSFLNLNVTQLCRAINLECTSFVVIGLGRVDSSRYLSASVLEFILYFFFGGVYRSK